MTASIYLEYRVSPSERRRLEELFRQIQGQLDELDGANVVATMLRCENEPEVIPDTEENEAKSTIKKDWNLNNWNLTKSP